MVGGASQCHPGGLGYVEAMALNDTHPQRGPNKAKNHRLGRSWSLPGGPACQSWALCSTCSHLCICSLSGPNSPQGPCPLEASLSPRHTSLVTCSCQSFALFSSSLFSWRNANVLCRLLRRAYCRVCGSKCFFACTCLSFLKRLS